MQEDNINFEEIGKNEAAHAEQSSALFKQPIRGLFPNLHTELKVRCDPQNFMQPYEPEKVSRANKLYSEILSIDKNDDEKLKLLRLRAMEELGIKFSTEQLFEKLIAACNPKNFTGDSYNKERLELANGLYQQILMNADDIFVLEEIEEKAKELLDTYNPHPNSPDNFVSKDINTIKESIFEVLFVFILIFFIMMLLSN